MPLSRLPDKSDQFFVWDVVKANVNAKVCVGQRCKYGKGDIVFSRYCKIEYADYEKDPHFRSPRVFFDAALTYCDPVVSVKHTLPLPVIKHSKLCISID